MRAVPQPQPLSRGPRVRSSGIRAQRALGGPLPFLGLMVCGCLGVQSTHTHLRVWVVKMCYFRGGKHVLLEGW